MKDEKKKSLAHICKSYRIRMEDAETYLKRQKSKEVKQISKIGWMFTLRQEQVFMIGIKFGLTWTGAEREYYIAKKNIETLVTT